MKSPLEINATCAICGKGIHAAPSKLKATKVICCSMECSKKWRSIAMSGQGNHQYGLKGEKNASFKGRRTMKKNNHQYDIFEYCPDHPYANKSGRVKLHRLIVERNLEAFSSEYFEVINGEPCLKKQYYVHHKDGNHDNNSLDNLEIVTRSEHRRIHNLEQPQAKDPVTGRFKRSSNGIRIRFTAVDKDAKAPKKASRGAGAYDLSAVRREELPNGFVKYYTGIAVEIPQGYTGFLYPRSSVVKRGLLMANSVGVIDSDFRGEISAIFVKTKDSAEYRLGDRMCQLLIQKTPDIEFEWADELSETARGAGGYGSTGR